MKILDRLFGINKQKELHGEPTEEYLQFLKNKEAYKRIIRESSAPYNPSHLYCTDKDLMSTFGLTRSECEEAYTELNRDKIAYKLQVQKDIQAHHAINPQKKAKKIQYNNIDPAIRNLDFGELLELVFELKNELINELSFDEEMALKDRLENMSLNDEYRLLKKMLNELPKKETKEDQRSPGERPGSHLHTPAIRDRRLPPLVTCSPPPYGTDAERRLITGI